MGTASSVETSFSTSTLTLLFLTSGTFLSCACANTLNMLFEPKFDALMTRTRNRPLVRNLVSKRSAALLLLGYGTNPTVAGLSALNIFLYAGVYTPMKRLSAANTWVGAIVGGIPPLMGWCAAAGEAATSEHHSWRDMLLSEDSIGGWALAALLFVWQLPLVLVGALVCKKGLWDGFLESEPAASIYDEPEIELDGNTLGMDSAQAPKHLKIATEVNPAMLGFKRPT